MNSAQFKLLLLLQVVTLFLIAMLFMRQPSADTGIPLTNTGAKSATKNNKIQVQYDNKHIYGNEDAKNELVVFTRYNCGFCRDFYNDAFDSLINAYVKPGKLKIVFMNNVNTTDKQGMLMARVAEIGRQLNVYEAIQKQLYANNQPEDSAEVISRAILCGVKENVLKEKLSNTDINKQILNDNKEVDRLHLTGTPAFVINGNVVMGFKGYQDFKTHLDELIYK